MREILERLVIAAERIADKYGRRENGDEYDWSEWAELRAAIASALNKMTYVDVLRDDVRHYDDG